jgi:hypothetical protein
MAAPALLSTIGVLMAIGSVRTPLVTVTDTVGTAGQGIPPDLVSDEAPSVTRLTLAMTAGCASWCRSHWRSPHRVEWGSPALERASSTRRASR